MTILRSDHANVLWNRLLIVLGLMLVVSAVYLVWVYTQLVNRNHDLALARTEFQQIQTANSELQDRIFALFGEDQLRSFAAAHSLVPDRQPRYLTVNQTWSHVSRY